MPSMEFTPSRAVALEMLAAFLPRAGHAYAQGRNTDPGPTGVHAVSRLSPYLRHRVMLESEVVAATLAQHSFAAAEKFLQEVFWRTYFKGWLEHHPDVWANYQDARDADLARVAGNPGLGKALSAAESGQTGIDGFDAWAAELVQTGYLHNHARMWFASIWIFTLGLPWSLGADFFIRHLLDGDPASNTLSWRWVAGLHTPGKHYVARAENIARFTNGRFHPVGQLNEDPAPLTEALTPTLRRPDFAQATRVSTDQCANHSAGKPADEALLLTDDDLGWETLVAPAGATALGLVDLSSWRSPQPVSAEVGKFVAGAIAGRAAEWSAHHCDCPYRVFRGQSNGTEANAPVEMSAEAMAAEQVADWIGDLSVSSVRMPWPVQGPTAAFAATLGPLLARRGCHLTFVLREWDRLAWPHAQKGFFKLKTQIPALVRAQSLG